MLTVSPGKNEGKEVPRVVMWYWVIGNPELMDVNTKEPTLEDYVP
jgi:hypothetical protein